ncbi:MAG: hypothetical protein M1831_002284 [Alyxoria varia]|nr:MAG: hypothetical protein M1831_002284 [Alyxoria varia]
MKRLFDRFPLVTYPPNESPVRPKQHSTTFENEDVLFVFCTEEDARNGGPSFNPGCLRWQTYLKFNKIPFRIRPSNNHASPSGALPFLLSASQNSSQRESPPITTNQFATQFQIPSPAATQDTGPQAALHLTLLNHPIRLSYLHALYIHPSTFYTFTFPRYVKPATNFPLVQAALCHPLRLAARQEIASHYDAPTTSSLWLTDREEVVEQLYRDAEEAWEALGTLLDDSQWFGGEEEHGWLDASVFAYTFVIWLVMEGGVNDGPVKRLSEAVEKNKNLQGQVDWVAFGNTLVTASIATLGRLSGAGVQELTYAGGLQLATRFRIGDLGQRRIEEAVQNLGNHAGFDNILYFGFGYRSFARMLAESVSGLKCLALCTCLAEMHSEIVSAKILSALWTAVEYPDEYKPSMSQFMCLIKACAGVITKTTFSETAMVMLSPLRRPNDSELEVSSAEDTARVLRGLFEISTGIRDQVVVNGGAECAFVAALSEWLFNFKTHVEDAEGSTLFTSCPDGYTAQVRVQLFTSRPLSSEISLAQSTFVLRKPEDMLVQILDRHLLNLQLRVPWGKCLQTVFANGFQTLYDMPDCLGTFLGSWSRIYRAHAFREIEFTRDWNAQSCHYAPEASYDPSLLPTVNGIVRTHEKLRRDLYIGLDGVPLQEPLENAYLHGVSSSSVMQKAVELFTGYPARFDPAMCTATVQEGICCYKQALQTVTADPEQLSRVYIIPGHVSLGHQRYDIVKDGNLAPSPMSKGDVEYQVVEGPAAREYSMDQRKENVKATALMSETGNELVFYYRFTTPRTQVDVQPGHFTTYIQHHFGAIHCDGYGCEAELQKCAVITTGFQMDPKVAENLSAQGINCCLWSQAKSPAEQVVVLEMLRYSVKRSSPEYVYPITYFRKTDCLGCWNTTVNNFRRARPTMAHIV